MAEDQSVVQFFYALLFGISKGSRKIWLYGIYTITSQVCRRPQSIGGIACENGGEKYDSTKYFFQKQ